MPSVEFSDTYRNPNFGYQPTNYVRVDYTEVQYDIVNNRTQVRLDGVYMKSSASVGSSVAWGTLSFNGTPVLSMSGGSYQISLRDSYNIISYSNNGNTVWVTHNADGTGSFTISLSGGTRGYDASTVFGAVNGTYGVFGIRTVASLSAPLTTRPRGSSISSCPSFVDTNGTFQLSVSRNSAAFYHIATIICGGRTLYTSSAFATSMSTTIQRAWLANWPNAAAVTATVSVQTYTDASCTVAVGSAVTQNFTINADADMKPSVSEGWLTLAAYNTGTPAANISGYVKGYSKAQATFNSNYIDLSNTASATIASYSITCQGVTNSTSPYLTPVLESTSVTVTCTVTDSRGRTASETKTIPVMDYASPVLTNVQIFRCDNNGDPDEDGTKFSVTATLTFSSLNSQNTCPMYVKFKAAGGTYGSDTSITSGTASVIGTISADVSYNIMIHATDSLGNTVEYYASIATRKWAMHFRPRGNGVAFGKAAENNNTFEIDSDWALIVEGKRIKPVLAASAAFAIPASGSSVSYNMDGLTTVHELARWNFSASAENAPPVNLTWATYDGYFTITNNGGTTTETMRPVFVYPAAVTLSVHT